jgi:hypothetical protein
LRVNRDTRTVSRISAGENGVKIVLTCEKKKGGRGRRECGD